VSDVSLFDAHLHADGLSDGDLRSVAYFGVQGALLPAHDPSGTSPREILAHFDDLIHRQVHRLWKFGVRAFVALGVHPARLPWHGLDSVLADLPKRLSGGVVVAIGEIGLANGDAREELALVRQLDLARELQLPALVHTPERNKESLTKRALAIIRDSGIAPERVLVDHVNSRTLRLIRECGYTAGLTVHPDQLTAEAAAQLVLRYGAEGLVVSSNAGDGAGDVLSLARAASVFVEAGVPADVARRVLSQNALAFYRIDRAALTVPPARLTSAHRGSR
jgi:uncharacterized protein